MNTLDKMLEQMNLSWDKLSPAEKQTLFEMEQKYSVKELTLRDVQEAVKSMIRSVERELTGNVTPETIAHWLFRKRRKLYLEARLSNLIFLDDFLSAPEKARKMIESMLKNVTPKK